MCERTCILCEKVFLLLVYSLFLSLSLLSFNLHTHHAWNECDAREDVPLLSSRGGARATPASNCRLSSWFIGLCVGCGGLCLNSHRDVRNRELMTRHTHALYSVFFSRGIACLPVSMRQCRVPLRLCSRDAPLHSPLGGARFSVQC